MEEDGIEVLDKRVLEWMFFFFQAEDGIRDHCVTGVQTCALPISAAFELAARRKVVVLERETQCGYHSTGRSAASFTENYGSTIIRRLASASRAFYESPPGDPAPGSLLAPRGMVTIGRADQLERLAAEL